MLSVVMVGRNDGYGGDFVGRTEASIELLAFYALQHAMGMELVLVDWNPPSDRKQLWEVLAVPKNVGLVSVIVPAEVHAGLDGADRTPMFEYRAKNVGIRGARGEWVLATNPDIILSEEMVMRLVSEPLGEKNFYRASRSDLGSPLPATKAASRLMQFCRENVVVVQNKYDAAGDFIMMRREEWFRLRGFAELTSNGMIDSLMVATAEKEGLTQVNLPEAIYHQFHTRDERAGRPQMDWNEDLIGIHNGEAWGLACDGRVEPKVIQ